MTITLPSNVAPNELIQSAWGNSVVSALDELDDEKLNLAGGTLTGMLTLPVTTPTANQATRQGYVEALIASNAVDIGGDSMTGALLINGGADNPLNLRRTNQVPGIDFQSTAGVRQGLLTCSATGMNLSPEGVLVLGDTATERARLANSDFMFGKTAADLSVAGVEVFCTGSSALGAVRTTTAGAANSNVYMRHESSADANTQVFANFVRAAGSQIGSVTQVNTTGVAYNTTSDERLKTVLRDLNDDEAAEILRTIAPVVFEFNEDRGNEHIGFIAQQLARTWPTFLDVGIVTPGHGEPGDPDEVDDDGVLVKQGFVPWQVDLSKLTPLLTAGWQALDRRIAALEAT